jgi:hypothetical protein
MPTLGGLRQGDHKFQTNLRYMWKPAEEALF